MKDDFSATSVTIYAGLGEGDWNERLLRGVESQMQYERVGSSTFGYNLSELCLFMLSKSVRSSDRDMSASDMRSERKIIALHEVVAQMLRLAFGRPHANATMNRLERVRELIEFSVEIFAIFRFLFRFRITLERLFSLPFP